MNDANSLRKNIWAGGYYELSIVYPHEANNDYLQQALQTLSRSHLFNGYWLNKNDVQKKSASISLLEESNSVQQFFGELLLNNLWLPCSIAITKIADEASWLDISIPQGALEQTFPYKYPLTRRLNPWLKDVDALLQQLAIAIYKQAPFQLAILGEEVSCYMNLQQATRESLQHVNSILPIALQRKLKIIRKVQKISDELVYC